jgi:hypothetical protein
MVENKCQVCKAEFNTGCLDKEGICDVCKRMWPGAKTPEDRNKTKKPEVESHEAQVKDLVAKQVNELLEGYGILHRCLACSNMYFKRSPAQKGCGCDKKEDN